jgi:hypothetical protein
VGVGFMYGKRGKHNARLGLVALSCGAMRPAGSSG